MILFIEERRSRRLRGAEVEELQTLALECLKEGHSLRQYPKTFERDNKLRRIRRRLSRIEDVLISRANLVLMARGGNRFEFVLIPTDAEIEALDRLEEERDGSGRVNWAGLEGGER